MSLGEADAKFPGQHASGLPPSPSRENPGQVFPHSDPKAAPAQSVPGTGAGSTNDRQPTELLGNPYVLEDSFSRLDSALTDVISKVEREERSVGSAQGSDALVRKFSGWRDELSQLRGARRPPGGRRTEEAPGERQQEGGLFTD